MTLLSFRMRWIQLLLYKIHARDDEKLCFAEKTSIILQKSGGAMAPLAPPVSTALLYHYLSISFLSQWCFSLHHDFRKPVFFECFLLCHLISVFCRKLGTIQPISHQCSQSFHAFHFANTPFLYPLKTSENHRSSDVFRG